MKMRSELLRRLAALLLCALCVMGGVTEAMALTVSALDEVEGNVMYPKDFSDTGITLMLPVPYTMNSIVVDETDFKQMIVMCEDEEAPCFVITAKRDANLASKELADVTRMDYNKLFVDIIGLNSSLQVEYLESYLEDEPAGRITYKDEALGRHTVGFRDDWVMVLSLLPVSTSRGIEGVDEYEAILFQYMLQPYDTLTRVEAIQLDDSNLCLTLPEGMTAIVDRYDEYTHEELVVYFIMPPAPQENTNLMMLTTVRSDEYKDVAIGDLKGEALQAISDRMYMGVGDLRNDWVSTEDGDVMLLREVGMTSGDHKNSDVYHLVSIKDGWLVALTYIDLGIWPVDEMLTLQVHFMQHLLAGDGEVPTPERDTISFDTAAGTLKAEIPHGFFVESNMDASVSMYRMHSLDVDRAIMVTFDLNEKYQGETIEAYRDSIEKLAKQMESQTQSEVDLELVEEGCMGEPTFVLRVANGGHTLMIYMKDDCEVNVSLQKLYNTITQEEEAELANLVLFSEHAQ